MRRRTLIRILVGLGIGVPVLIEVLTVLGLIENRLFGGDRDRDGDGESPTATPVPRIGVGDELIPDTPQTETLAAALLRAGADAWTLSISVEVDNATDAGYELRLGSVTTGDGTVVEGGTSTGRVPPGGRATVSGRWKLPSGSTPEVLSVVAVTFPAEGEPSSLARQIRLAKVPVQGE